jgi:hypothetical protein
VRAWVDVRCGVLLSGLDCPGTSKHSREPRDADNLEPLVEKNVQPAPINARPAICVHVRVRYGRRHKYSRTVEGSASWQKTFTSKIGPAGMVRATVTCLLLVSGSFRRLSSLLVWTCFKLQRLYAVIAIVG